MRERIGFRTAGYRRLPIERALGSLAEIGFHGVELCLEHPDLLPERLTESRCADLVCLARGVGIEIASVSYHGDADPLPLRWERALAAVALAPALGTDLVIVNSPRPGEGQPPDLDEEFRYQLSAQLELAEIMGVTIALEPEPGLLVESCADMLNLIAQFGYGRLRVNLDVGHAWLTEPDVSQAIAALDGHLAAVHIEDMAGREHRHLVPGTGEMDLPGVIAALRAADFDGWLTVDLFDITDDPDAAARACLDYMGWLVA